MTKKEFLHELQIALQGEMDQAAVNENLRFYDNYIMEVNLDENFNTYAKTKKLYINKKSKKPEKLEIYDNAKNIKVCIIYNYIEIK